MVSQDLDHLLLQVVPIFLAILLEAYFPFAKKDLHSPRFTLNLHRHVAISLFNEISTLLTFAYLLGAGNQEVK